MKRLIAVAAVLLTLSGCVLIDADVTPYSHHPPRDPVAVEVLSTGVPDAEFDEVGLIEVTGNYHATYGKLIARAREEAAAIGADAIVVSRRPITTRLAQVDPDWLGTGTAVGIAGVQEDPRIWVVAIRWKK